MVRQRASMRTSYMAAPTDEVSPDDPLLGFAPVPHVAPRRNSITAERQRAFIAHLAATGIVRQAAKQIGASLEALYKLRSRPGAEAFSAAWDEAVDRGVQRLEDCALASVIEGEERLVVSGGKVLGVERRRNAALTMFFLKNRRPQRYGDQVSPGHPMYERIKEQVLAEIAANEPSEAEVLESINKLIDDMKVRSEANTRLLAEEPADWDEVEDEGGDGSGDGSGDLGSGGQASPRTAT